MILIPQATKFLIVLYIHSVISPSSPNIVFTSSMIVGHSQLKTSSPFLSTSVMLVIASAINWINLPITTFLLARA
nr:MAG TPA: hypothetical protein [Caudoviricetes sp.]